MTDTASNDTPAADPPPGVTPNFVNPPSLHSVNLGVSIACLVLMIVVVGVRTYTKAVILRDMRHEDYVALLVLFIFLAWGPIYTYLSSLGLSRDLWNIRASDMPPLLRLCNDFQLLYSPAMGAAKYFICVHLKRIFCPSNRGAVHWTLVALITVNVMFYLTTFFAQMFQCIPREKIWRPDLPGSCMKSFVGILAIGVANLVLDLGILLVPIWAIWKLQIPVKRKLKPTQCFRWASSAVSIVFRVPKDDNSNAVLHMAKVGLWSFAELTGTMIVGCIPFFPLFLQHFKIIKVSQLSVGSSSKTPRGKAKV
uniref:Rhodopsin domain-containing protein n=1 Tax=Bionectria ochroleuca TaxID=29856 RepID=A0A8H7NLW4_BIOOC